MNKQPTVYLITYLKFNHNLQDPQRNKPLDSSFLGRKGKYLFYLLDESVPESLKEKETIVEKDLDQDLHLAGGKYFGEWSFLLAEEKYAFAKYPLFMISSRFFDKNKWLLNDLNYHWDALFAHFETYGWGYLPSYDRPLRWIDLSWQHHLKRKAWKYRFFPFTEKTYELIEQLYGVSIPGEYRFTADLFCNYIGFRSRTELLEYVEFYKPLIEYFFNEKYELIRDLRPYVRCTGTFKNEKAFTFILELVSHLFFFVKRKEYFALHYDGYYTVNEAQKKLLKHTSFSIPFTTAIDRICRWQWRKMKTEGILAPVIAALKK